MAKSPWRIALVASSSWSHAFLCEKNRHLWPDVASGPRALRCDATRRLPDFWRQHQLDDVENSGQSRMLNWFCLVGAMSRTRKKVTWSQFYRDVRYNSTKSPRFSANGPPGGTQQPLDDP